MFKKILIANRGEIAARVIRTARQMGIATVAVYSDADAESLAVSMADEAVHIGGNAPSESYLLGARIIKAALRTGAEAIHPGFGFLSENPDFVEEVEAAGLKFIGPSAHAIRAMGLKDAAKALMEKAGVPVVPGYQGENQEPSFLADEAEKIGYPVLIKAVAGGGGKGMRRVDAPADFKSALASAQAEAKSAFGNPNVLIEKYIEMPRHIEVQVFGDNHGNVVHLFERDCSLQRRHQKVIEEAPAPGMTEEMRAAMGKAAVDAAKAIKYSGAGTIEFIVDGSNGLKPDGFWFMEMNTRLQVEHPVTEAITGTDLVAWQIMVAAGLPLPKRQEELSINGWAFEARIYAEDAEKGFLPATGRLSHLKFPECPRIETGVRAGDKITPFYDPMIAKLITHGATREQALHRFQKALGQTEIQGTVTNIRFLQKLAAHEAFSQGEVDTGLIARDLEALTAPIETPTLALGVAAVACLGLKSPCDPGFRLWGAPEMLVNLLDGDVTKSLHLRHLKDGFEVEIDDETLSFQLLEDRLIHEGHKRPVATHLSADEVTVFLDGESYSLKRPDPLAGEGHNVSGDAITAPMPGLVCAITAQPGQAVKAGERLGLMEAMKMELGLEAPRDGVIASVFVEAGQQVEAGAVLIELEPDHG